MNHNAGTPSPPVEGLSLELTTSVRRLTSTRQLGRRSIPVALGALLALAVSSATASATDTDGEGKKGMCAAIGCSDGGRECAKASGTMRMWMFVPFMPYYFPMEYTITATCYEEPAI